MPGLSVQPTAELGSEPGWLVLELSASYPPECRKLLGREEQGTQLGQDQGVSQLSAQLPQICLPAWPHLTGGTTNPSLETTLGSSPPHRPLLPSPVTTRLCYVNPSPPAPPPDPGSVVFRLRSGERLTVLAPSQGALVRVNKSAREWSLAQGTLSCNVLCQGGLPHVLSAPSFPSVPPLAAFPARLVISGLCD